MGLDGSFEAYWSIFNAPCFKQALAFQPEWHEMYISKQIDLKH